MISQSRATVYLKVYAAAVCCFFAVMMITNWLVDPFNELKRNTIGLYFSTERQAKSDIVKSPHDAVLLGSSKAGRINPKTLNCYTFYNASFDAAMPEEIYLYLKRYITHERLVMIELDFYMFNERQWPVHAMKEWPEQSFGKFEYLINFNTFKSSLFGVYKWYKKEPAVIAQNGQKIIADATDRAVLVKQPREAPLKEVVHIKHDFSDWLAMLTNHHYRRYLF